jgi:FkbM family methyltransferase
MFTVHTRRIDQGLPTGRYAWVKSIVFYGLIICSFGTIGYIGGKVYADAQSESPSSLTLNVSTMSVRGSISQRLNGQAGCYDTCSLAKNGVCDDGSNPPTAPTGAWTPGIKPMKVFSSVGCDLGTDCTDCGQAKSSIPEAWASGGPISHLTKHLVEVRSRRTTVRVNASSGVPPELQRPLELKFAYTDPKKDTDVSQNMESFAIVEAEISEIFIFILHNRCIRPDGSRSLFVDVGANFGWFSILAASMGCRVLAFEPVPHFRAFFEYNVHLNGLEKLIDIRSNVASHISGQSMTLSVPSAGYWGTAGVNGLNLDPNIPGKVENVTAQSITLTDAVKDDVLLMKIDVEGWEFSVMKGAAGLLSKFNVENIVMEYSPGVFERSFSFEGILSTITMLIDMIKGGYKIGHIGEGKGFLSNLAAGPLARNQKTFEEVTHHNLLYDVRDAQLFSEMKLGCPVAEVLQKEYHWPCQSLPEDLNPRSFRSIFGHNTNVWASKNMSLLPISGHVGMTNLDTPSTQWYLRKQAGTLKPGDARNTVFSGSQQAIGMGMRPCVGMEAKYNLHHRCPCQNEKICGEEAKIVVKLAEEGSMPGNYVLPPP